MNILPLLTFYFINSKGQFTDRDINFEIAQSLRYVMEKFFVPRSSSFSFLLSSERPSTMTFYTDVGEIFFGYWSDIKTQIVVNSEPSPDIGPKLHGEKIYNILLIDSWESFLRINLSSKVDSYNINEYYHIFLHNDDRFLLSDMTKIFEYCWKHYIINVNVQVQKSSGEIIVYTYFPFQKSSCGDMKPVEINRFVNEAMQNEELFPLKLDNMFQCPLKAAIWDVPPYLMLDFKKPGRGIISGLEGKLLLTLSEMMNFKIDIVVPPNNEKRGTLTRHRSTGAIGMLLKKTVDLSLGCFWFSEGRSRILTATDTYFQASNVAILLAESPYYHSKHALWFPFKPKASLTLFATFFIILGLLYLLTGLSGKWSSLTPINVKHRSICLNFIASTLGMPSSLNGPQRNSKRIFIMAWILFTLIIRTNYGAEIYHLIRNNLFIKPPSMISDILNLNYTFALNRIGFIEMGETSVFTDIRLNKAIVDGNHVNLVFQYLEERPNERIVTIAPLEFLLYYLVTYRKIGVHTILREKFMNQNSCIYLTKHSYLADKINSLLLRINSVGLMDAWVKQSIDLSYFKVKRQPKVMTIGPERLYGIYFVCGGMLVVAFLIFCLEILSKNVKFLRYLFD